eukprot:Gb_18416 [translate_table: standard]
MLRGVKEVWEDFGLWEVWDEDNVSLVKPISLEELEDTISKMKKDKLPGLEGSLGKCFQGKLEYYQKGFVKNVARSQGSLGRLNATLIALISKEKGPMTFDKFRPISLCNVLYKIITKLMENRLKLILPKLILEEQGGFVQGKRIVDNVVIAQKALHSGKIWKLKMMLIKLDMAKAYDCLDKNFLLKVLEQFGFCKEWRQWVEGCISNPSFLVLVNGSPTGFFKSSRGIRQGCPLFPSLFIMATEALGRFLGGKTERGLLAGGGGDNKLQVDLSCTIC